MIRTTSGNIEQIKIKISNTCVYKEYEVQNKIGTGAMTKNEVFIALEI